MKALVSASNSRGIEHPRMSYWPALSVPDVSMLSRRSNTLQEAETESTYSFDVGIARVMPGACDTGRRVGAEVSETTHIR